MNWWEEWFNIRVAVIRIARSQIGLPYAWGGGNYDGPTLGIRDGGIADQCGDYKKIGFDCSGLTLYCWAQGANIRTLTHYSADQYLECNSVPDNELQMGDLVFWSHNGKQSGIHHVAIFTGSGTIVEAYQSCTNIREVPMRWNSGYYGGGRPHL